MLEPLTERSFADHVARWLEAESEHAEPLRLAALYAAWATLTPEGKAKHHSGVLFKTPHKLDMHHLVPRRSRSKRSGLVQLQFSPDHWRHREGFQLTDAGTDLTGALDQAQLLHQVPQPGQGQLLHRPQGKGRRLQSQRLRREARRLPARRKNLRDERWSKSNGNPIGALAIVTVDNPMAAATGHRICNDCMKSCIFQKQEPVDIPQVETRTLKDVLELPWGFEIYSLLTRWNPLNFARPFLRAATGYKVLVVGLGPAGLHARASSDERRPHRGRGRWPQDRTAAGRYFRRRRRMGNACRSARFTTSPKSTSASTSA